MRLYIIIFLLSIPFAKETVRIYINSMSDYIILSEMGIELDHHRTDREVHAYATDKEINALLDKGYQVEPIINQARAYYLSLIEDSKNSDNPFRSYHNYDEMTDFLTNINSQYPDITSLESIGQSVQGRELWVMQITDNPNVDEPEPEFKYIANMHGDETVGRELSLYLIEWLVEGYENNQRASYD